MEEAARRRADQPELELKRSSAMATTWHGVVNPPRPGQVREWRYDEADIRFAKGDEMGRFLLGSTVVLLWPKNTVRLDPAWHEAMPVRLGQKMAEAM